MYSSQYVVTTKRYNVQRLTVKVVLILTNILSKTLSSAIIGDHNDGLKRPIFPDLN